MKTLLATILLMSLLLPSLVLASDDQDLSLDNSMEQEESANPLDEENNVAVETSRATSSADDSDQVEYQVIEE